MRILNGFFLVAFLLSIAVQHNDPDPLRWMVLYGAAAACCLAWERRWGPRWLPALPCVVALGWLVLVLADIPPGAEILPAMSDWHMKSGGSEELREAGGLLLVGTWMAALGWRPRRENA